MATTVTNPSVNTFLREVQINASQNNAGNNAITGLIGDINTHNDVKVAFNRLLSGEELGKNPHAILTGGDNGLGNLVTGIQAVVAGMSPAEAMEMYESMQKGGTAKNWLSTRLGNLENITQEKVASYRQLAKVVSETVAPTGLGRVGAAMSYSNARETSKNTLLNTGKTAGKFLSGGKKKNSFATDTDLKRRLKEATEAGDEKLITALKKERHALSQEAIGGQRNRGFNPNDNFAQRFLGRLQVYSPGSVIKNTLNGTALAHFRTLEHSQVGFEQAIGKFAGGVIDNKGYRGMQRVFSAPRRIRSSIRDTKRMKGIDKFVAKWRHQRRRRLKATVGKTIAKLGGKIIVKGTVKGGLTAVFGVATGGAGFVLSAGYETLNFLTGGALDSVVVKTLKLIMIILSFVVVMMLISFCGLLLLVFNTLYSIPNRFKLPRPVAIAGLSDEQKLAQLKIPGDNSCPWQGGACTQGPYGCVGLDLATHYKENANGDRESFSGAIDVGLPAGAKLRAPESGTVLDLGSLQCGDGNIAGGQFTLTGDSGTVYDFLHANATTSGRVEKDDVIGVISNFIPSACMTGAHLHTNVTDSNGKVVNAEDFFNTNSCNIDCNVACAVPDNIVPL